ncbi:MAG: diguanylate cyclase [Pseudomonadota bacterium]
MNRWFFSLLAVVGAQREGSQIRRAAFVGWMSAPVYLWFSLWMLGGWWLARSAGLADTILPGYAVLSGLGMSLAWLLIAMYGIRLDRRGHHGNGYVHFVLWTYSVSSCLACYAVGTFSIFAGLVMMGAPLIGTMLFTVRQVMVVFGTSLALMLAVSVASALGHLPYAPVFHTAPDTTLRLYYALGGVIGAGLYVIYEVVIMVALVSAWHYREAGVLALSQTDALTGVANRRHIIDELETLLAGHRRDDEPVAVLMVDIDHFKQINDRYGHLAGDRALTAAAGALRHCLRGSDRIGRYGGEEFLILLPGAAPEKAGEIAERCRHAVHETVIPDDPHRIVLTASIGVSSRPARDIRDADHIIHLADAAMYAAKQAGRNRVTSA